MGWLDIVLRLGSAMLIGGTIGLNRDLHHKPTGMRTLDLLLSDQRSPFWPSPETRRP